MQSQEFPGGQPFSGTSSQQASASPHFGQRQTEICPGCRAPVASGEHTCQRCGTILHSQPQQQIRCRHCRKEASSAYAICPHCGRALAAAPPLALTVVLSASTLLLLVLILLGRMVWTGQNQAADVAVVENAVLMTPVRGNSSTNSAPTGGGEPLSTEDEDLTTSADGDAVLPLPSTYTPTTLPPTALLPTEAVPAETLEATPTPTLPSIPTQTATAIPTPSVTSTATATTTAAAATSAPTATTRIYTVQESDTILSIATRFQITVADLLNANQLSPVQALKLKPGASLQIPGSGTLVDVQPASTSPTPTPTATPSQATTPQPVTATSTATVVVRATLPSEQIYTLQEGDTLVGIALRFNISTEMLMSINGLTLAQARFLLPGQQIIVPVPGQPLPPTATPGLRRYVVQSGDTIIEIAAANGISTNLLLAVNGMTAAQAPALRVGDELLIPAPGYMLPTATPRPTPVPTRTAAPTPTPTPTNTIRLDAPTLLDPAQDINVSCGAATQIMRWNPVNGLAPGDEYMLFLGYVNSAPDAAGNVQVVPLFEQRIGQDTNWQMNPSYCNLAPQTFGRRWRWYVQVFSGNEPVSPPSPVWEFTWR